MWYAGDTLQCTGALPAVLQKLTLQTHPVRSSSSFMFIQHEKRGNWMKKKIHGITYNRLEPSENLKSQ